MQHGAKQAFDLEEIAAAVAKGFTVDVAVDFWSSNVSESLFFQSGESVLMRAGFSLPGGYFDDPEQGYKDRFQDRRPLCHRKSPFVHDCAACIHL